MLAPLRVAVFRRTWSASLFSNFGLLVQGVGAAWAMTELTSAADMVALVQTASVLPLMLFAMFAGAIADTYRSEEHTSELQSLMRISYAVFCLKKKKSQPSKQPT